MREVMHRVLRLAPAAALVAAAAPSFALDPSQVFEKVAPSVWAVRGLDAQERPLTYGSGVVVADGRLVTNCHVLAKAKAIQVRRDNVSYEAKLEHADVERDLCMLAIAHFSAPHVDTVALDQLKIGQRVYAVGNPEKLALTLSEGLISGLRSEDPRLPPVQTTAPISPGSSGGGLFDDQGRLIGITTLAVVGRLRIAQNLNFAMPAQWIAEMPERSKAQLARRRERGTAVAANAAPPAEGLPSAGTSWKYSFRDERYSGATRMFTVRVESVDGFSVKEAFTPESGNPSSDSVNAREIRFLSKRLTSDYAVIELAPYFYSSSELGKDPSPFERPASYGPADSWRVEPALIGSEEVQVPAGSYKAVRVEVSGVSLVLSGTTAGTSPDMILPARFHYVAWYAPEVNRYVKVRHETWNKKGQLIGDEIVQLVEWKHN